MYVGIFLKYFLRIVELGLFKFVEVYFIVVYSIF